MLNLVEAQTLIAVVPTYTLHFFHDPLLSVNRVPFGSDLFKHSGVIQNILVVVLYRVVIAVMFRRSDMQVEGVLYGSSRFAV